METEIAWLGATLVGILFRQVMRIQEALAELAKNMAIAENSRIQPTNYQNSITPPWLANLWIALAVGFIGSLIAAGYFGGVWGAGLAVIVFLGGMLVSGLTSMFLSQPSYLTYYRLAFHTLANREADYRRDGDVARADAAQHFQWLMVTLIGDKLANK